jgi:cell division protein FtsZ
LDFGPVEDKMQGIIKVIGVGGGGCNAVRNMYDEKISGVTLAVCNRIMWTLLIHLRKQ